MGTFVSAASTRHPLEFWAVMIDMSVLVCITSGVYVLGFLRNYNRAFKNWNAVGMRVDYDLAPASGILVVMFTILESLRQGPWSV